ncbi:hypothetical protein PINS_up001393 [Pythium insidiosum]|nr:hypothetical protein PINS_up001393 [Pythium insidiosum]
MASHLLNEYSPLQGRAARVSPARELLDSRTFKVGLGAVLAVGATLAVVSTTTSTPMTSVLEQSSPTIRAAVVPPQVPMKDAWRCGTTNFDAGYVAMPNKNDQLFYWYVESSRDAAKAPLVLWLSGAPGTSGLTSMLTENGPCSITDDLTTKPNPYSWTNEANVVWLDQPTGVGFSYASRPEESENDKQNVGANVYWFLQGFLAKHPELENRDVYLAGEGYAGQYIPLAARYIQKQNAAGDHTPIKLQGVAIGNACTNTETQYANMADTADRLTNSTALTANDVKMMRDSHGACVRATKRCQAALQDAALCAEAQSCWMQNFHVPFLRASRNPQDVRQSCSVMIKTGHDMHCEEPLHTTAKYLSLNSVRQMLHVKTPQWNANNVNVQSAFVASGDFSRAYDSHVEELLNNDVRVLLYAGDQDAVCGWSSNAAWSKQLEWKGKGGFNAAAERPLVVAAERAGDVHSFENLSLVRVYDAGRKVPKDQPAVALAMLRSFLHDGAL